MQPAGQLTTAPQASPWIAAGELRAGARLRLFCFPYAGGSARIYRGWRERLPPGVDVCALQLPGRERRLCEPPLTTIDAVVESAVQALRPWLDVPFVFFGHSMGALVAFELARRLRDERLPAPAMLYVSARPAPQCRPEGPPTYNLPDEEFLASVARLNGMPRELLANEEAMGLLMPALRADFTMCETYQYRPGPPLACPIEAFGGLHDPDVSRRVLDAWREQTADRFTLRMLPGDHFFIHSAHTLLLHVVARGLHDVLLRTGATTPQ